MGDDISVGERADGQPTTDELDADQRSDTQRSDDQRSDDQPDGDQPDSDQQRAADIEQAVRLILSSVGENPDRDGLLDTPARVARSYRELLRGYQEDPADHLDRQFEVDHDEMVIVRDIPFSSMCEHHMLPFIGRANVAYLPGPGGKVCGLSKLARVVDGYAKRLQVQERLVGQVADAIVERLSAAGVLVVIEAEHLCMSMRGVQKPGSMTTTSAVRGLLKENAVTRAEALGLIRG